MTTHPHVSDYVPPVHPAYAPSPGPSVIYLSDVVKLSRLLLTGDILWTETAYPYDSVITMRAGYTSRTEFDENPSLRRPRTYEIVTADAACMRLLDAAFTQALAGQ